MPAVAVVPDNHRLGRRTKASLRDLRDESFIVVPEEDAPGYNEWVRAICRKAGFQPRFTETSDGMSHLAAMIAAENLVAILPRYAVEGPPPGVHVLSLSEAYALADLFVVWKRGKLSDAVKQMLDAFFLPRD